MHGLQDLPSCVFHALIYSNSRKKPGRRRQARHAQKLVIGVAILALLSGSAPAADPATLTVFAADTLAVADFSVIPKYLFGTGRQIAHVDCYAGFARHAIPIR